MTVNLKISFDHFRFNFILNLTFSNFRRRFISNQMKLEMKFTIFIGNAKNNVKK